MTALKKHNDSLYSYFINTEYLILMNPVNFKIKNFVKNVFKEVYNADINYFQKHFMYIEDKDSNILSAVGFKTYQEDSFLVEKYTGKNVYELIDSKSEPNKIIEIGNLGTKHLGLGAILIHHLIHYFAENTNIEWAFFTGTQKVINLLKRNQIDFSIIGEADKNKIENFNNWGTYYDQKTFLIQVNFIKNRRTYYEQLSNTITAN